jgi:ATP adenylyltransferase
MAYLRGHGKPDNESVEECPFCRAPGLSDEEGLVVRRGSTAYVVLNLFPYAAGHLLVCPYRHIADYTDASADEVVEVAELTRQSMRVIRSVSAAQGFNIGINQGAAGGAGIAAHLHQHVVPRWAGDANFLAVVGRTKAMPELLEDTRVLLADAWDAAGVDGGSASGR